MPKLKRNMDAGNLETFTGEWKKDYLHWRRQENGSEVGVIELPKHWKLKTPAVEATVGDKK